MKKVQKAIVIGMGNQGKEIASHLLDLLREREIGNGGVYPDFLYEIYALLSSNSSDDSWQKFEPTFLNLETGKDDKGEEYKGVGVDDPSFRQILKDGMSNVSDASKLTQLKVNRDISVGEEIQFYLIAPIYSQQDHKNFISSLKHIHDICKERSVTSQARSILLMPELGNLENSSGKEKHATAYSFLKEIEYFMNFEAQSPWRDSYPLENIWLIDRYNDDNEAVASFNELSISLAEALFSMTVEGILVDGEETGVKMETDSFYSTFGFTQLVFPRSMLRDQIADKFEEKLFKNHVLKGEEEVPFDVTKTTINSRKFIEKGLHASELDEEIKQTKDGKGIIPSFEYSVDMDLAPEDFLKKLSGETAKHEDRVEELKVDLIDRAKKVNENVQSKIRSKVNEIVDSEEGLYRAGAFYDSLLGEGESSDYTEGEVLTERKSLPMVLENYKKKTKDILGIEESQNEATELKAKIVEKEEELENYEERIESRESERQTSDKAEVVADSNQDSEKETEGVSKGNSQEDIPSTLGGNSENSLERQNDTKASEGVDPGHSKKRELKSLKKERDQIKAELGRLREKKSELKRKKSLYQDFWGGSSNKKELLSLEEKKKREKITEMRRRLSNLGKEKKSVEQELESLREDSKEIIPIRFLYQPMIFLGIGFLLTLGLFVAFSIDPFWLGIFLATILVGTYAWTGKDYYSNFLSRQRELTKKKTELKNEIESLKRDLVEKYRNLFKWILNAWSHHRLVTEVLGKVIESVEENREEFQNFIKKCEEHKKKLAKKEYSYPESLSRTSVITEEDWGLFLDILSPEGLKITAQEFFGDVSLSEYARSDRQLESLRKGVRNFALEEFQEKIDEISIEELIFDYHEKLSQKNDPNTQLSSLLSVAPFLPIRNVTGGMAPKRVYTIGVEDEDRSRVVNHEIFQELPQSPNYYSHYDNSKILSFCRTTQFSIKYLSQLPTFRKAYKKLIEEKGLSELHHPLLSQDEIADFEPPELSN